MPSMPTPPRKALRKAPRKTLRKAARRKPTTRRELVLVPVRLDTTQVKALELEARRRTRTAGRQRADLSEVLRDAVSVWMAIRPGQRAIIRAVAARRELTRPEVLREALDAWLTSLDPSKL